MKFDFSERSERLTPQRLYARLRNNFGEDIVWSLRRRKAYPKMNSKFIDESRSKIVFNDEQREIIIRSMLAIDVAKAKVKKELVA